MITKLGVSLDRELLVQEAGKWYVMSVGGSKTLFVPRVDELTTIAEWNGCQFRTRRCVARNVPGPFSSSVDIVGARNPYLNGRYHHILGGFKNKHDVWYVRSLAGQRVLVFRDGSALKVLGVAAEEEPMGVDVSITSSEIKLLFKEEDWALCKRLVWELRLRGNAGAGDIKVAVAEIPNGNKGRQSSLFVPSK